jgi:hypothetical protein
MMVDNSYDQIKPALLVCQIDRVEVINFSSESSRYLQIFAKNAPQN